ncbi:hypothetical protein [Couchioplanes caeruleus]|uniref:Uncharacterized protein n=2 Tax=Couchioplanes caeruleus TaxID=56438 RepID=A0A1K0FQW6_9ACTN|nr:hypothetical protein [Couchioplanes caeruleus]OJF15213.1 hypothetical protein BG844_05780 [Couchioplanes caeruleus subsp. caeruleus]ROP28006.1 hypothetical protein EDD30_0709 [Couchioplanes caeruleus]
MNHNRHRFEQSDDSGFLALLDPDAYAGFVAENWTYDSIFEHFRKAMMRQSLLLWGTGREDTWTVDVLIGEPAPPSGFRRAAGPIRVSGGRLYLANYEALTMAAQFPDTRLPEPHDLHLSFEVPADDWHCEIVQMRDPDLDEEGERILPDFVLALTPSSGGEHAWTQPAWHDA